MTSDKSKRPLLAASDITSGQNDVKDDSSNDDYRDDVDDFVTNRHIQMAERDGLNDSDSDDGVEDEPETTEYNVLDIHSSDSDEQDFDILYQGDVDADEEKGDWGGKRRNWYGGDTHEYEIMEREEREEILQDEEEEAIRLQKKALERARPEDYLQDDEYDLDGEVERDEGQEIEAEPATFDTNVPAPELNLLAREFQMSLTQLSSLKEKSHIDRIDRIKYQLVTLFVTNAALYFSLRTDPESVGVDLRTHPVLSRIVQIRSLLRNAKSVSRQQSANGNVVEQPSNGKLEGKKEENKGDLDQSVHQTESDGAIGREVQQKQRREKRKKEKRTTKDTNAIAVDEAKVLSLLQPVGNEAVLDEEQAIREQKRRKLNKIVGAMERERKNSDGKRMASADLDLVREEVRSAKPRADHQIQVTQDRNGVNAADLADDDEVMRKMLAKREKKAARKAKKAAASTPHVYTFRDQVDPDGKRKASTQVIKNRGLTRYRPRDKKTPRTKNRLAYGKAVTRRKGAVREYAGAHGGSYGGEASGINMSARKSSIL